MLTLDQASTDENIRLFRKDVRSLKKQIISANIQLTDKEAQQFWPVYDRYTSELDKIEDRKFELLQEYARDYSTITDEQADAYIKGRAAVEESILQLRLNICRCFVKSYPAELPRSSLKWIFASAWWWIYNWPRRCQ